MGRIAGDLHTDLSGWYGFCIGFVWAVSGVWEKARGNTCQCHEPVLAWRGSLPWRAHSSIDVSLRLGFYGHGSLLARCLSVLDRKWAAGLAWISWQVILSTPRERSEYCNIIWARWNCHQTLNLHRHLPQGWLCSVSKFVNANCWLEFGPWFF